MKISVINPISLSINWVKHVLFEDFNLGKWFTIGFCAFLATLGEGGGSGGSFNHFSKLSEHKDKLPQIKSFIIEHIFVLSVSAGIFILFIIALAILIQWLSCRGKFMFLDNVVRNRAEVKELWRKFKSLANSLLIFKLVLIFVSLFLFLVIIFVGILIAWPDISIRDFGQNAIIAIISAGFMFVIMMVAFGIINVLTKDFCVPIMYRRNVKILEAIEIFKSEIAPNHFFDIFRFFLMKILLSFAIVAVSTICCCCTCCIAGLPYIGAVIMLPLIMFSRCYSLFFLEQFGDEWLFFEREQETIETEALTFN